MNRRARVVLSATGILVLAAGIHSAHAQEADSADWLQCTALSLFAGSARAGSTTSAAAGAAVGWELTPHFTIEGSGAWVDRPSGSTAFTAVLGTRVHLAGRRILVPFASGGVGLYREGPAMTDFAVSAGGGLDVFVARHLAVRPEVRVLLVNGDSSFRSVTIAGVNLAYHFESHKVTPARRRAH